LAGSPDAVVHLIDDDEAVRHALAFLLTNSGFAVRVYESAFAFLNARPQGQCGCIVTDLRMPGLSGLELQAQLKDLRIGLPVILITGHGDVRLAVEAMKAGAMDFIEKPFDDVTLVAAIRLAIDRSIGGFARDNEAVEIMLKLNMLSAREAEVLEGLVAGHANKAIAQDLGISPRTVEVHRANLMAKMGAPNLSSLVRMVFVLRAADTKL